MRVSVIIPTHNRASLLKNAIQSVLDQTYEDFEVIVVSDGSTDNTDKVMEEFKKQDSRIRYINYSPSVNGSHARNVGIKAASGEVIAFLDDDDTWFNEKLEKQVNTFKGNPDVGLVTTGIYYIYVNEKIIYESIPNAEGDVSKKILISNCVGGTQAMIKKSILDKSGGFDENLRALQDYDLWIRVCQLTKVATVNEPCINYYNYRGSKQVSQITENYEIAYKYITEKYSDLVGKLTDREKLMRENATYLLIANKAMRNNNKKVAYQFILRALKTKLSKKTIAYLFMAIFDYKVVLRARKVLRV